MYIHKKLTHTHVYECTVHIQSHINYVNNMLIKHRSTPQCHQLGPRVRSPLCSHSGPRTGPQRGAQKDGHGHCCQHPVMVNEKWKNHGFEAGPFPVFTKGLLTSSNNVAKGLQSGAPEL